jgi:hypothetical protein
MKITVIVDFDKLYSDFEIKIPDNTYIISNYNRRGILNIKEYEKKYRQDILDEMQKNFNSADITDLIINSNILFLNGFLPLGLWFKAIDEVISKFAEHNIEFIFSSYSNNKSFFLFEAEGEVNSQILYHDSYFISYYLKLYVEKRGYKISYTKNRSFSARVSLVLRNVISWSFKFTQILFYRLFYLYRSIANIDNNNDNDNRGTLILSRGIVHTNYIKNFYFKNKNKLKVLISEASFSPLSNRKYAKKMLIEHDYIEGAASINNVFKVLFEILKSLKENKNKYIHFFGININISSIQFELLNFIFNMRLFAINIKNHINKNNFFVDRIISFEILFPFVFYIKNELQYEVYQLQTTALYNQPYANFIYGDKFSFLSLSSMKYFMKNKNDSDRAIFIENLKYYGVQTKKKPDKIKNFVFFTQPINKDDEKSIINYLVDFTAKYGYELSIKLHPRSKSSEYSQFHEYLIQSNYKDSIEVIQNADLVITRTSSIAYDSKYIGVPIIFFVNKQIMDMNLDYIPRGYRGIVEGIPNFDTFKKQIDDLIAYYYEKDDTENVSINCAEIDKFIFN